MSKLQKQSNELRLRSVKYKLSHDLPLPYSSVDSKRQQIFPFTSKHSNMRTTSKFSKPKQFSHNFSGLNVSHLRNQAKLDTQCPEDGQNSKIISQTIAHENIFKRSSYLESFHSMIGSQKLKNRYISKRIDNEANKRRLSTSDMLSSLLRVQLPSLNELDSQFMLLDHVSLPIGFISEEIVRIEKEMKVKGDEKSQISQQMKGVYKKINHELDRVQQHVLNGLQRLHNLLNCNKIGQQQTLLSIKNSLQSCTHYLPDFGEKLQESKQKVVKLQEQIFQDRPFELEPTVIGILQNQYF